MCVCVCQRDFKQVSREGVILRGHLSTDLKEVRGDPWRYLEGPGFRQRP